ncbi:zinc ribbon-containing protein [Vogesella oryzae]|uniref:zinc ribbon-containing protein n=1 Tax=Vogesella oryzae TaxID=1735285 RepID=UPI00158436A5|nr:hypothetical protein [Vogesella oryzae]
MNKSGHHDPQQPSTDPPPEHDQHSASYDRFVAMSRELFEKGQERSSEAWEKSMELAREQLARAGEFSSEQGEQFKHYLRRDMEQTLRDFQQLGESTMEHLHPARLGAGMLSSLAKLFHVTGSAMSSLSEKAEEMLEYRTGEITTAGTLTCKNCGQKVHLTSTSMIPPCPSCHGTHYRKGY